MHVLVFRHVPFEHLGLIASALEGRGIGIQYGSWNRNQELDVLSQAMYQARELAMSRMEAEADALGADGIVGVRLDVGRYEWGADLAEFIALWHLASLARWLADEGRAERAVELYALATTHPYFAASRWCG